MAAISLHAPIFDVQETINQLETQSNQEKASSDSHLKIMHQCRRLKNKINSLEKEPLKEKLINHITKIEDQSYSVLSKMQYDLSVRINNLQHSRKILEEKDSNCQSALMHLMDKGALIRENLDKINQLIENLNKNMNDETRPILNREAEQANIMSLNLEKQTLYQEINQNMAYLLEIQNSSKKIGEARGKVASNIYNTSNKMVDLKDQMAILIEFKNNSDLQSKDPSTIEIPAELVTRSGVRKYRKTVAIRF